MCLAFNERWDMQDLMQIGRLAEVLITPDSLPGPFICVPPEAGRGSVLGFMPGRSGTLCITTAGSTVDTVLSLRERNCTNGDDLVCNDDWRDTSSLLEVDVFENSLYYLFVGSVGGNGRIQVTSRMGPCPDARGVCNDIGLCPGDEICVAGDCYDF